MHTSFDPLNALSPLDGRYQPQLIEVAQYFSEFALIRYRLSVEVQYLLFLSDQKLIPAVTTKQSKQLTQIIENFDLTQAQEIKKIEETTRHDVKAVEYFLREKVKKLDIPVEQYIHLGLTSEDTNSISQSLLIKNAFEKVTIPHIETLLKQLTEFSKDHKKTVMLARTHGQPAIPTTIGKEFMVYAMRLHKELQLLKEMRLEAKLSGAVGNFSAQQAAFPKADWIELGQKFITSLGLEANLYTNQIVPAETYSRLFGGILRIHTLLIDLDQDIWRYISDGYFDQKVEKGQVGSSTMPQKINPIDFENSEGNFGLANALLVFFIQKLPISRLQRDLSDSTVKRNIGVAFGHSYLAVKSLLKGLGKITVNETRLKEDLDHHWEIVSEAFQVILRAHGDTEGYEKLKFFSQGKHITQKDIQEFIESLNVDASIKNQLSQITPFSYIGSAIEIVEKGFKEINSSSV